MSVVLDKAFKVAGSTCENRSFFSAIYRKTMPLNFDSKLG